MAIVRKTVLLPGTHKAPAGNVVVTPERSKHYQDKFRELNAQGVEFGVPWSHLPGASPDEKQFLSSRLNAGYIKDLIAGPDGKLDVVLDCPGLQQDMNGNLVGLATLPDGSKVQTAIREVSAGIWPSWTDGKGQTHQDIIGHVALTTMPVIAGMDGFQGLSTNSVPVVYLSTITLATDDPEDLKKEIEAAAPNDEPADDPDLDTLLSPQPSKPDEQISQLVQLLAECGSPLPEDTTRENIVERLLVALGVLKSAHEKLSQENAELKDDTAGQVVEESGPSQGVMMSTLIKEYPMIAGWIGSEQDEKKAKRAERLQKLKPRGVPVDVVNELSARPVKLSTLDRTTGKIKDDTTDVIITYLERSLPSEQFAKTYLSLLAPETARELVNPAGDNTTAKVGNIEVTADDKRIIEERAARASGHPVKGV